MCLMSESALAMVITIFPADLISPDRYATRRHRATKSDEAARTCGSFFLLICNDEFASGRCREFTCDPARQELELGDDCGVVAADERMLAVGRKAEAHRSLACSDRADLPGRVSLIDRHVAIDERG